MYEHELRPPNRQVPLSLKLSLLLKDLIVANWLMNVVVASLMACFFLQSERPIDLVYGTGLGENIKTTKGVIDKPRVLSSRRTRFFHYEVDGVKYETKGYQYYGNRLTEGTKIEVLYNVEDPSVSKIKGHRRKPKLWPFDFLFIGVGALVVLIRCLQVKRRAKLLHKLLQRGYIASASYTGRSKATLIQVSKQRVFEFFFETEPWKQQKYVLSAKRIGFETPKPGELIQALVYPEDKDVVGIDISEVLEKEGLTPSGDWPSVLGYWYLVPVAFIISASIWGWSIWSFYSR